MAAPLPNATLATPAPPPLPSLVNARRLPDAAARPRAPALGARRGPLPAARQLLPAAAGRHAALVDQRGHDPQQRAAVLAQGTGRRQRPGGRTSSPSPCTAARWRSRSASPSPSSASRSAARSGSSPAYFGGWVDAVLSRVLDIPDRVPRPGARAGHRRGARAERVPRDLGTVGVPASRRSGGSRAVPRWRYEGCRT